MEKKPTILAACIGGPRHKVALASAITGALAISTFLQGCGVDRDSESLLGVEPSTSLTECSCHAVCHCDVDTSEKRNVRQTSTTYDADGICTCDLMCSCDMVCTCNSVCSCDTEHSSGSGSDRNCSCNTICTCNVVYR